MIVEHAVEIIRQAAGDAKSIDPRNIAAVMHSGRSFQTVVGDIGFDGKGDVRSPAYVMYVWKKGTAGKITYIEID